MLVAVPRQRLEGKKEEKQEEGDNLSVCILELLPGGNTLPS